MSLAPEELHHPRASEAAAPHAPAAPASLREFSFPLNVFAHLLWWREGRVDYLHFAVFDAPDDNVLVAQERASALLWQALPVPGRLLEVGVGLGTTLSRLRRAGFDATGITPDPAQIAVAQQRHGNELTIECARLEEFTQGEGSWDSLLFQESGQYIEPLNLLAAADRLLKPGRADLVVMDEFALDRREAGHRGLHHLEHFCALAARFGWRLALRQDLSRQVQPTHDWLLRALREERQRLMTDLGLDDAALDGLAAALERSRRLYADGVYGYALLRFERDQRPHDRLVRLHEPQAGAVRGLFGRVFGHELSAAEWAWKYGEWRGHAVGIEREGELLAHYGGLTRRVLRQGQPDMACQVCDVMVDPRARASLARQGPLHQVTATFLETQIGWGLPHALGFGFPTERAFAVAERMGLYAAVDQMVCAQWPAQGVRWRWRWRHRRLEEADLADGSAVRGELDALWQRMAKAHGDVILGVRDADWIRHRYLRHPRFRYEVWLVQRRWPRRCLGLVVLRRHENHLEWVDVVAPPEAWGELLTLVRARAQDLRLAVVEAWVTRSQQDRFARLAADVGVRPLGIDVPANAHTPGPAPDSLRERWLLMAGDTDFR